MRQLDGKFGFLNYEVSAGQLARWLDEIGVPEDRLFQVNLRGRRNPVANDQDKTALARLLLGHEVEALAVDPFGRAYTGASQNDPGEVAAWFVELDQFVRNQVGAKDLFLSAHAGWNGERTRGASSLEDWADSIITIPETTATTATRNATSGPSGETSNLKKTSSPSTPAHGH